MQLYLSNKKSPEFRGFFYCYMPQIKIAIHVNTIEKNKSAGNFINHHHVQLLYF